MNPYINIEDTEMDMLDLGKYLLRKAAWILLAGLICAGIAGAYRYFTLRRAGSDQQAVAQAETEYELDVERFEQQSELLDASDKNTLGFIQKQKEYLQNSLLMQLDPYHVWTDAVVVNIVSDESNFHARQFRELYKNELLNGDYLQDLAKERETDPGYLSELICVDRIDRVYGIGTNNSVVLSPAEDQDSSNTSSVISITTYGKTKAETQDLMDVVVEKLQVIHEKCEKTIPHEIRIVSRACAETVDTNLRQRQKDTLTFTQNLTYQMKDNVDKAALLSKPAESAEPAGAGISKKSLLKYGLIGFAIGVFLMCLWYALRFMFNDKLVDYKGIEQNGMLLKQLGSVSDQGIAMVAANIRNFAGEKKQLFLTGMATQDQFDQICSSLREYLSDYQLVDARDIIHDPKSRELLLGCEAAVLIEQKGETCYSSMKDETIFLFNAGKEIIGVVIV